MFHAMVLLAIVLGLGPLASLIPHAVLAGIFMKVGIDIIDWGYLERVPRAPRAGVVIMLVVLVLTVFVDLIIALATGMVAASLLFVKRMSGLQMTSVRAASQDDASENGERAKHFIFPGEGGYGAVPVAATIGQCCGRLV